MRKLICACALTWAAAGAAALSPVSAQQSAGAPVFNAAGQLVRPLDYREWVFVTSGIGMTYGPAQPAAGRPPMFDNVFVTRDAYRAFLENGRWPDKTMFVLEIRRSLENVSINQGGRTQGEVAALEAAVKDEQRFRDTGGWAYFTFGSQNGFAAAAAALPSSASCYQCHAQNTAVENTFVQFYPELFAAARRHGTVKAGYRSE